MAKVDFTQVERNLRGLSFPVSRDELIESMEQQSVDEQACQALRQLPDQKFRSVGEVSRALNTLQGQIQNNSSRTGTR